MFLHEDLGICVLLSEVSPGGGGGRVGAGLILNHHAPGSEDALPLNIVPLPSEGGWQSHAGIRNLQKIAFLLLLITV